MMDAQDNTGFAQVQRPSLRHSVRLGLEEAILRGDLKGGQRLNEVELAQRMGVSRGVIREVLREMETAGVLVNEPYRGTFVREWTPRNVTELYTLRSTLEEYAAELAAQRATPAEIDSLVALVQEMHAAALARDAMTFVDLDLQFHRRMYMLAEHSLLLKMLDNISGQTHLFIMATKAFYTFFSTLDAAASSHDEIIDTLRRHDPEAARAAVRRHICEVGEQLAQQLATEVIVT